MLTALFYIQTMSNKKCKPLFYAKDVCDALRYKMYVMPCEST